MSKSLLLSLIATTATVLLIAGCGGGPSTTSNTAPNSGSGNAALNGKYVFSINGVTNQKSTTPTELFIAGVFAADGKGSITGGAEDSNQSPGFSGSRNSTLSGTYSIGSDGRGTMNLTANGTTNTFAIVVESNGHGQMIFFNNATNGFGTFDLQSSPTLTTGATTTYAFGWNGFDNAQGPQSFVGVFPVASGGAVANGIADINDDGYYTQMGISGSISAADSNGRGTATMTSPQLNGNGVPAPKTSGTYTYYVISASRAIFLETDGNGVLLGEADTQTNPSFTAANVSGNYVLSFSGDASNSSTGTSAAVAVAGQFTADGISTISPGDVTENIGGTYAGTVAAPAGLTGSFAIANSVNGITANGRGTISLSLPDAAGATDQFVFYMVSPQLMYVMESDTTTTGELMSGQVLSQTGGPFTAASLTGNYGLQFSGVDTNFSEWDFSGQFAAGGTSTITGGTVDINEGKDQTLSNYTSSTALSGASYTVGSAGFGQLTLPISGTQFQLTFYFVSPTQLTLIQTDGTGLTSTGAAQIQPTIP